MGGGWSKLQTPLISPVLSHGLCSGKNTRRQKQCRRVESGVIQLSTASNRGVGQDRGGCHNPWGRQNGCTDGDQPPLTLTFRGEKRKVLQEIRDDQRGRGRGPGTKNNASIPEAPEGQGYKRERE